MTTNEGVIDKKKWLILGIIFFTISCAAVIIAINLSNAKTSPLVSFIQSDGKTVIMAENAASNSSEVVYININNNQELILEGKIDKGEIRAQVLPMEINNSTPAISEIKIKGKETKEETLAEGDYTLQMTATKGTTGSVIIYVADRK